MRSDVPPDIVLKKTTDMRDSASASGAHIASTDFPSWGVSARWRWYYVAQLKGGRVARCNPVNAPKGCEDNKLD